MRPRPLQHPYADQESPPQRPINERLADNAYQAGYLMEYMRAAADRLERGASPVVIAEALREVIENCERAMGRK
jgi:hypothetical protein